jgi:hypothetical protein
MVYFWTSIVLYSTPMADGQFGCKPREGVDLKFAVSAARAGESLAKV